MKKGLILFTTAAIVMVIALVGCGNEPPVIESFAASADVVAQGSSVTVICTASDDKDEVLNYSWVAPDGGTIIDPQDSSVITWAAPYEVGDYRILCTVSDAKGETASDTVSVTVGDDYFPMAIGYQWLYRDDDIEIQPEALDSIDTITYEIKVLDFTEDDSSRTWDVERTVTLMWGEVPIPIEETYSYIVKGDSVWMEDPSFDEIYLALVLPLWVGKTWDAGYGATGEVTDKKSITVPAGTFADCMRVEIRDIEVEGETADIILWLAPDIGIIQTSGTFSFEIPLPPITIEVDYELELIEYDLD